MGVIICDRDHCVAAAGVSRKEVLERRVSASLEEIMDMRSPFVFKTGDRRKAALEGVAHEIGVAIPIVAAGDIAGAVVLTLKESFMPSDSDLKLATVAAGFLGKQMEDF